LQEEQLRHKLLSRYRAHGLLIGARVAARAKAGEVLVSRTVKDLVAGSGTAFIDRGEQELKGVPGEWHLYTVSDEGGR